MDITTRYSIDLAPQVDYYTWCHGGDECEKIEDIDHASVVIDFAMLCYENNLTGYFNYSDMVKFGNTISNKIYDSPLKTHLSTYGTNTNTDINISALNPIEKYYCRIANYIEMAKIQSICL